VRKHYAARVPAPRVTRHLLVALVASVVAIGASPVAAQTQTERVRVPFPAYDCTLTPYTFGIGYPLVTLVYDTLMWRDQAGIPQPWLAQSVTSSNGGRRVTVRLRSGVRWHDDRPLTAADVVFTYRYVAANYQPRFTPQLRDIANVSARGRSTVVFNLRRPSLGFEDQPLSDVPIIPRHLWRELPSGGSAPAGLPVGSGPYRLVSANRRRGYVLRANTGYFRGEPRVQEIRVPIIDDAERTYDALRTRKVDMVPLSLAAPAAASLRTGGLAVRRGPFYAGTMLVLNVRRAPFSNLEARKTVSDAIDLDLILRRVAPAETAEQGFIHPESRWAAGATPERPNPSAEGRRALDAKPFEVLAPSNDPVRLEAGRRVVAALTEAGIPARLGRRSRAQLDRAIGDDGSTPNFDAAITSIPTLVSHDPDGLTRLFSSNERVAPLNASGYSSDEFDGLARDIASTQDETDRRRLIREQQKLLIEEAPAIALFFPQGTFAFRGSSYNGWAYVKGDGILDKQSFLTAEGGAAPPPPEEADPAVIDDAPAEEEDSGGISLVNVISIVALIAVGILGFLGLREWRRNRPD
jgi:peptide/nickel transport system substrate-binding protein